MPRSDLLKNTIRSRVTGLFQQPQARRRRAAAIRRSPRARCGRPRARAACARCPPLRGDRHGRGCPAVSTSRTGTPSMTIVSSIVSRVVPGVSDTIARSIPKQGVEQRRLSGVGRSDDRDVHALAHETPELPVTPQSLERHASGVRAWRLTGLDRAREPRPENRSRRPALRESPRSTRARLAPPRRDRRRD